MDGVSKPLAPGPGSTHPFDTGAETQRNSTSNLCVSVPLCQWTATSKPLKLHPQPEPELPLVKPVARQAFVSTQWPSMTQRHRDTEKALSPISVSPCLCVNGRPLLTPKT